MRVPTDVAAPDDVPFGPFTAQVNDARRLAAARRSGLLDTPADEPFDRLARTTAMLLEAPLAFVTVVDEKRSFWKSCIGVDATDPADRQNPVEESFCQYVVGTAAELIVNDAATDHRTRDNPSVEKMGVRAWAGFPLHAPDGEVLGSFCVVDLEPRDWTERDIAVLRTMSAAASSEVALRAAAEDSRQLADTLQQALLPPHLPDVPGWDVAALYRPAGDGVQVAGDFYDLFAGRGEAWHAIIGDVCGKGVEAATLTGLARWTLRGAVASGASPREAFAVLNAEVRDVSFSAAFLSTAHLVLERTAVGAHVTMAVAGHPAPLVRRADGRVEALYAAGPLLGIRDDVHHAEVAFDLAPGDAVVLFTDGLVEAREDGEQLGLDRVREALAAAGDAAQLCARLDALGAAWTHGRAPADDTAVLVLRVAA